MPPFRNHGHHFRDDDDKSCVKVCGTLLLANYANPHFPLGDTLNCPDLHIITSTSPSSSPSPASPKKALLGVDHHWETSMMRWKLAPMVANYVLMVSSILHPFDHSSFMCTKCIFGFQKWTSDWAKIKLWLFASKILRRGVRGMKYANSKMFVWA